MTTVAEGRAILQAILDEPDEDLHRLAHADWLEENGQPDRAEFARVGRVEFLRFDLPTDDGHWLRTTPGDATPRRVLLAGVAALGDVPWPAGTTVTFRRGFVETVRCPLRAWLDHGGAVAAAHPVTRVEASDKEPMDNNTWGRDDALVVADGWERPVRPSRSLLPRPIWDALRGHDRVTAGSAVTDGDNNKHYRDRAAAIDALSDALLRIAKGEA